jgi:hypothetical protein
VYASSPYSLIAASRRAQRAQPTAQHSNQPLGNDRRIDLVVHRHDVLNGHRFQHCGFHLADRASNCIEGYAGANRKLRSDKAFLNGIAIDSRPGRLLNIVVFGVSNYADNLVRDLVLR